MLSTISGFRSGRPCIQTNIKDTIYVDFCEHNKSKTIRAINHKINFTLVFRKFICFLRVDANEFPITILISVTSSANDCL